METKSKEQNEVNKEMAEEFTANNKQLVQDIKNVLISVSVGSVGYFLIELGKGLVQSVVKNGIKIPELSNK
jgi:hypothetical protein